MYTNYDELIPKGILFNLRQIEEMGIVKVAMAKKLIINGELEIIRIGNKIHVSRQEVIRYIEVNTVSRYR